MKHTMIKMLSLAMALIMIVSTMASVAAFAATCDHANAVAGETFAPTCEDYGYTLYHCPDCGEDIAADVKAKVGHKVVSVKGTAATCDENATVDHFACEWCELVLNEDGTVADDQNVEVEGSALGHTWGKTPYIFAPTCEKKGYVAKICDVCYAEEVIPLSYEGVNATYWGSGEHTFEWTITKLPVCDEDGVAELKCTACPASFSFVIDHKTALADGEIAHEWEDKTVAATCTKDGFNGYVCKACGAYGGTDVTTNPATGNGTDVNKDKVVDVKDGVVAAYNHKDGTRGWKVMTEADEWFVENNSTDNILSSPASCLIEGWHYEKCDICGEHKLVTEEIKPHNFDYANYNADPANLLTAQSCTAAEQWVLTCTMCNEAKEIYTVPTKPALGHDWADVSTVSATCTDMGHTLQDCTRCDETRKVNVTPALGHNWVAKYTCPACTTAGKDCDNCTHAGRVVNYICTAITTGTNARPGCGISDATRVDVPAKCAEHNFTTSTKVPANCVSGEFLRWTCGNVGCKATKDDAPAAGAAKNPNNHKSFSLVDEKAPTCQADGYKVGFCDACGDLDIRIDLPKSELDLDKRESHTVDATVEYKMDATCCTYAVTTYRYSCCNHLVIVYGTEYDDTKHGTLKYPEGTENKADTANAVFTSGLTFTPFFEDCEKAGKHANYKCSACNKTFITSEKYTTAPGFENFKLADASVDNCACADCTAAKAATGFDATKYAPAKVAFDALGHDYQKNNAGDGVTYGVAAGCESIGYTDRYVCTRCDKVQAGTGKLIPALGHDMKHVDYKAPTCTEKGSEEADYCARCGLGGGKTAADFEIPALEHTKVVEYNAVVAVDGYCGAATFQTTACDRCVNCGLGKAAHIDVEGKLMCTAEEDSTVYKTCGVKNSKVENYTSPIEHNPVEMSSAVSCVTDGKTWKECTACGEITDEKVVAKATGHYILNADGTRTEILTDCDKIDAYKGQICAGGCGLNLTTIEESEKTHNVVEVYLPATCVDDGVKYYVCADCDEYFYDIDGAMIVVPDGVDYTAKDVAYELGHIYAVGYHTPGEIKNYVAPTTTDAGSMTFVCTECGEEVVYVIPAENMNIEYNVTIKGYNDVVGETDTVVNTGDVKVIVGATTEAYKFRTLSFVFEIGAMTLDKVVLNYKFDATLGVEVDTLVEDGYLTVLLTATAGKNAVIEGTDVALFDVYFNAGDSLLGMDMDIVDIECLYVEDDEVYSNFSYVIDVDIENSADVNILGDASGDYVINTGDVIAMMDIIYTAAADVKYNAAADINRDGKVDVADFAMLKKFVMSDKLFGDYAELIGTENNYSVADAIANSNYLKAELTKYDLNEDGKVDANDTAWFVAYAEDYIADLDYEVLAIFAYDFEMIVDEILAEVTYVPEEAPEIGGGTVIVPAPAPVPGTGVEA